VAGPSLVGLPSSIGGVGSGDGGGGSVGEVRFQTESDSV
jgi:hypothetical protein